MAAFYSISIEKFLIQSPNEIFANLATAHLSNFHELNRQQEKSWKEFIRILFVAFTELKSKDHTY